MIGNIVKWGNSQGIIIPKSFMEQCHLKVNTPVNIELRGDEIVIRPTFVHKALEERAAEYGGSLGNFEEFDWGGPKGRELW